MALFRGLTTFLQRLTATRLTQQPDSSDVQGVLPTKERPLVPAGLVTGSTQGKNADTDLTTGR